MTRTTSHLARLATLPDRPTGSRRQAVPSAHDMHAKCCPDCYRMVYNAVRVCPACGYVYYGAGK